jgi:hypothetical protein
VRLPTFLNNIPRLALILIVPAAVFLIAAAIGFGAGGGGGDNKQASGPTEVPATAQAVANTAVPTVAATPAPTATPAPNRADCSAIRGTSYQSDAERDWYTQNCTGTAAGGGGLSGGSSTTAGAGPSGSGEYALGDRLVIPAAGVNAPVSGRKVGADGVMPDPVGYFNAVWYDFSALGLGGYVTGGNLVVAGHVDCGRCYNGGAGTAVFYNTRYLSVGDTIQYITASGTVKNYTVFSNQDYPDGTDFSGIVSPGAADITIITCTGVFSGGHYNYRNVVQGRLS